MIEAIKSYFWDPETERRETFLRGVPLFERLGRRDLARLASIMTECAYSEGETVFREGDVGRALALVCSGRIEISRSLAGGKSVTLRLVEPGGYIGEMALLDEAPRSATAVAVEASRVYLLHKARLSGLMLSRPAMGMQIIGEFGKLLAKRFREAETKALLAAETPR
ncbi:MAG: cyclic nucleotide-binding domain-containing protein [Elusimicrobia bacterium]|nr:cyclic nucleotide-binding domain-containing protein [Elusimicrobiota bacterium]